MYICALCNGFSQLKPTCRVCGHELEDMGKVSDYFDDYSAYMEIDQLKLENGLAHDFQQHQCTHLFYCVICHYEGLKSIQE
ncbi:hypothetical protein FZC66_16980 [Priestia megaterium]|nr:hypothetical protein FZC66_16980 [Priestia megaterium]